MAMSTDDDAVDTNSVKYELQRINCGELDQDNDCIPERLPERDD